LNHTAIHIVLPRSGAVCPTSEKRVFGEIGQSGGRRGASNHCLTEGGA